MELSRKETYRNQKVSIGVTLLSFVVMLTFFIFTNFITAIPIGIGSSTFVASPQIALSMDNENPSHSGSLVEKKHLASSFQKENPAPKNQTAPAEIPMEQGAADIANRYRTSRFVSTTVNTTTEMPEPLSLREQNGDRIAGSINTALNFDLEGRSILAKPAFNNLTQEEGKVVVEVTVDKNGIVTEADPNGRGTSTSSSALKREAAKMALATKFNPHQKFEEQRGTITIIFSFN